LEWAQQDGMPGLTWLLGRDAGIHGTGLPHGSPFQPLTKEDEGSFLQDQAKILEDQLEQIRIRLEELKKQDKEKK